MKQSWKPHLAPFRKYKKEVFRKAGITGEYIYSIGETPLLRQPSQEVPLEKIVSSEFQRKLVYLKSCMLKYRAQTGVGRGITAIQVGIPEKFSIIYRPDRKDNLLTIINPVITKSSVKKLRYPEICMSANPIIALVVRPAWIEFDYYDEKGKLQQWKLKDTSKRGQILNRVVQHEIDHMNGIINIDLVASKDLIFEVDPTYYYKARFEEVK
jgi:peptide deformylase